MDDGPSMGPVPPYGLEEPLAQRTKVRRAGFHATRLIKTVGNLWRRRTSDPKRVEQHA